MTDELPAPQPAPPEPVANPMPVKIHLVSNKTFIVPDLDAWTYTEQGVFATGHFQGYLADEPRDILVPYAQVEYYEFDFGKLKAALAEQHSPKQESDESPSA